MPNRNDLKVFWISTSSATNRRDGFHHPVSDPVEARLVMDSLRGYDLYLQSDSQGYQSYGELMIYDEGRWAEFYLTRIPNLFEDIDRRIVGQWVDAWLDDNEGEDGFYKISEMTLEQVRSLWEFVSHMAKAHIKAKEEAEVPQRL